MLSAKTGNKKIIFPFIDISCVKRYTTRRNNRIPIINRLFCSFFLCCPVIDFIAIIFNSIGYIAPTIIFSGFNEIDFIAASRSHFDIPKLSFFIQSQTLWTTDSESINFRFVTVFSDKRIPGSRFSLFCYF